jgi:hypothetical protein
MIAADYNSVIGLKKLVASRHFNPFKRGNKNAVCEHQDNE